MSITLRELISVSLEKKVDIDSEIQLEVGGDGAIHKDSVNSVIITDGVLTLSGEYA